MRPIQGASVFAIAALITCAACATRVAETRPTTFTQIAPDTVLSVLQVDEARSLCVDVHIFYETAVSEAEYRIAECGVYALSMSAASGGKISCPDAYASCSGLVDPSRGLPPVDVGACDSFVQYAGTCKATVGDLGACLFESAGKLHRLSQLISGTPNFCDGITGQPNPPSRCPLTGTCAALSEDIQQRFRVSF